MSVARMESGPASDRDPDSPSPGLVTGLVIGFLTGAGVLIAAPGIGEQVRGAIGELAGNSANASAPPPKTPEPIKVAKPQIVFPNDRPLTIGVFGDSMADGIWAAMYRHLHNNDRYDVVRFSRASTGLARYDYVDVEAETTAQLATRKVDIAVICIGANDGQGIAEGRTAHPFNSPEWRALYAARIDRLVAVLRAQGTVVYWVGLPKMKRAGQDAKAQVLNALYAERMAALGVPFFPTVALTVDGEGAYDAYLQTANGKRLMRAQDGIHMTTAGYLRLAMPVTERIAEDVARYTPAPQP